MRFDTIMQTKNALVMAGLLLAGLTLPDLALAHCDGLDGPVVAAARQALEIGNVDGVLIWVNDSNSAAIRQAFDKTVTVRRLSPEAKELADMYFFETLVRLHRAGEGAPFTGLKPAGRDLGPAIPAADRAVANGSTDVLEKLIADAVRDGIHEYFAQVMARKSFPSTDIQAGREYIEAYVTFVHYVERLYESAAHLPVGHAEDSKVAPVHNDD